MKSFIYKSFSFKTYGAVLCTIGVSALIGWLFYIDTISKDNENAYHQLVAMANPINSNMKASPYKASQHRQGITKDIYFLRNNDRQQLRLTSTTSTLILDNQESGLEIIEKMQVVKCIMQEELYYITGDGQEFLQQSDGKYIAKNNPSAKPTETKEKLTPMQRVRYMEADFATYYYKSEKLVAEGVKIYNYILPSHEVPTSFQGVKPVMTGTAQSIEFTLENRSVAFTANGLKATFFEQGQLF